MKKRKRRSKIHGLDGLRTLALFGVLFYHAFPDLFKGGYFGVIIFFVISGYLAGLTAFKIKENGKIQILSYYKRRFLRMYPELVMVLLITIGVMVFVCPNKLANTRAEVMSILLGYNNNWQISLHADYFANLSQNSPFTHLWYIAVLIQFEIIWPFLYLVYDHIKHKHGVMDALITFSLFTILTYLVMPAECVLGMDLTTIYYSTFSRVFSLLSGCALGLLHAEGFSIHMISRMNRIVSVLWVSVYFVLSIVLFLWADGRNSWVYLFGFALYTILTLFVLETVSDQHKIGRMLDIKPAAFFSRYSYEIYLFQYPILFLATQLSQNQTWLKYAAQFAILLILSVWLNRLAGLFAKKMS